MTVTTATAAVFHSSSAHSSSADASGAHTTALDPRRRPGSDVRLHVLPSPPGGGHLKTDE